MQIASTNPLSRALFLTVKTLRDVLFSARVFPTARKCQKESGTSRWLMKPKRRVGVRLIVWETRPLPKTRVYLKNRTNARNEQYYFLWPVIVVRRNSLRILSHNFSHRYEKGRLERSASAENKPFVAWKGIASESVKSALILPFNHSDTRKVKDQKRHCLIARD